MYSVYSRVFPVFPYSRYSVYSPVFPYSRVFPVFPCIHCIPGIPGIPGITGIPGYTRYSRYSRYSRVYPVSPVFPCIPGIPVYSRIPVYSSTTRAPRGPLSPEAHSLRGAVWRGVVYMVPSTPLVACPGVYPRGTPLVMPRRGVLEHPVHHPPPPRAAQEWASGLNRPRGDRVGMGSGGKAALVFSYLRSFWPGHPDRP